AGERQQLDQNQQGRRDQDAVKHLFLLGIHGRRLLLMGKWSVFSTWFRADAGFLHSFHPFSPIFRGIKRAFPCKFWTFPQKRWKNPWKKLKTQQLSTGPRCGKSGRRPRLKRSKAPGRTACASGRDTQDSEAEPPPAAETGAAAG